MLIIILRMILNLIISFLPHMSISFAYFIFAPRMLFYPAWDPCIIYLKGSIKADDKKNADNA